MEFKTYSNEANYIIKVVKDAYKIIKNQDIEEFKKGSDDLFTNLDLACEKFIVEKLRKKFKDFAIVSEEYNANKKMEKNCFTIDPIDGTENFANGLPHWSIQVAMIENGKNVVSVLYFPIENELFVATLGGGAYLNEKPIHVNVRPDKESVYNFVISHTKNVAREELLNELGQKVSRHSRNFGSQSYAFACVACGRLGATLFGKYTRYDIEPGRLLVLEAGGAIAETPGEFIIAASNKSFAKNMYAVAKKYFE